MPSVSHQLLFSDCVAKAGPVPGTGFARRLNGFCHRARLLVWAGAQPRPPVGLIAILTFGQPNTSGFSIYHVAFAKIHPSSSKSFAARLILQAGPWCICACQYHAGACLLDAARARPVFFICVGGWGGVFLRCQAGVFFGSMAKYLQNSTGIRKFLLNLHQSWK